MNVSIEYSILIERSTIPPNLDTYLNQTSRPMPGVGSPQIDAVPDACVQWRYSTVIVSRLNRGAAIMDETQQSLPCVLSRGLHVVPIRIVLGSMALILSASVIALRRTGYCNGSHRSSIGRDVWSVRNAFLRSYKKSNDCQNLPFCLLQSPPLHRQS
jgi:hypothetical protein